MQPTIGHAVGKLVASAAFGLAVRSDNSAQACKASGGRYRWNSPLSQLGLWTTAGPSCDVVVVVVSFRFSKDRDSFVFCLSSVLHPEIVLLSCFSSVSPVCCFQR